MLGGLLALGCSGWLGESPVEQPPRGAARMPTPKPTPSTVIVPITVSMNALRKQLNASLPKPLYQEKARPVAVGFVADTRVFQRGDIGVFNRGQRLRFDIPVRVRSDVYYKKRDGSKGASVGKGNAEMDISALVDFTLRADWTLQTQTQLDYSWKKPPKVTVGGVKLDLGDRVDGPMRKQLPQMEKDIDKMMAESTALRDQLTLVWRMLHQPRKVNDDPELWISILPQQVYANDPQVTGRGIELIAGLYGNVQVTLGEPNNQKTGGYKRKLPPRQTPPSKTVTRISVPMNLRWDALTKTARQQLKGMRYDVNLPANAGKAQARLIAVKDIYPSGKQIAVGAQVSVKTPAGAVKGVVWVLGTPVLDAARQQVRLTDFTFATKTDSVALNATLKAARAQLGAALEQQLVFPLKKEMDSLRKTANAAMRDYDLGDGLRINANFDEIALSGVRLTDPSLVIDVLLEGELALKMTVER